MPAYRLLMTADTVGGVWRYTLDMARELSRADVAVTIATLGPRPTPPQRREAEGAAALVETNAPLDWLCEDAEALAKGATELARLAQGFDLVQFNGTPLAGVARFETATACLHHSCLATWWAAVKAAPFPSDWVWRRDLVRRHLAAVDAVAAPTRAFAQATAAAYDLAAPPTAIFNGRPWPQAEPVDAPSASLMTAGRLWDEGKNAATLDRAARRLTVPVYAAGPVQGPNGARADLAHVCALGDLSEAQMRARLRRRPLFVSTARYEPFGLAVLEAAQAGCALLLSDIATFRELWDEAALFFPPGDDAALAQAALALLGDPALRATLSERAQARARQYGLERAARATRAWHQTILRRAAEDHAA